MRRTRWLSGVLASALAALPALAQVESAPASEVPPTAGEITEAEAEWSPEPLAGNVARASFTSQIIEREPQDSITSLSNDQSQIFFFTEFQNLEGHTLSHVWKRGEVEMARVPFVVNGPRWRVYSSKKLEPSWLGDWTVSVVDENDRVLRSESFSYVSTPAESGGEQGPAPSEETPLPAAIE